MVQTGERLRQLEHFFFGIVGHVKDKWGQSIYGWREASRLANYWHRHFRVEEVPYDYHKTQWHEEHGDKCNPADEETADTSTMGIPPATADQVLSVPLQISQLAHILYDVLIQDPEFNAPVLDDVIQTPPQNPMGSNVRLLTRADLAQLSSRLALTANAMAQSDGAEAELFDDDDGQNIL